MVVDVGVHDADGATANHRLAHTDCPTRLKPGESESRPTAKVDNRIARADEPPELAGVHLSEGRRERLVVAMVGGPMGAAIVRRDLAVEASPINVG